MNELPYGLRRVAHTAHKAGKFLHQWEAHITFVTTDKMLDEIAAQRDLEALVLNRELNLFGNYPMLGSVNFDWSPSPEQKAKHGDIACIITVGYHSDVENLSQQEIAKRLLEILP